MSREQINLKLPKFAEDLRRNLSLILDDESLGSQTKWGLLMACAFATQSADVIKAVEAMTEGVLSRRAREAALSAASIMAMQTVYCRLAHMEGRGDYAKMPPKLYSDVMDDPRVPHTDFDLWSFAVIAINGCSACMRDYEEVLLQHGLSEEDLQTAVRYAAVTKSAAVALAAAHAAPERSARPAGQMKFAMIRSWEFPIKT